MMKKIIRKRIKQKKIIITIRMKERKEKKKPGGP